MKTRPGQPEPTTLAKPLAPEDVRVGDDVAVLDVEHEYPAIVWHGEPPLGGADEVVRVRVRPTPSGSPLRVVAACLPWVCVTTAAGKVEELDLRAVRLARLDPTYAKRARQARRRVGPKAKSAGKGRGKRKA